jgi:hypothetical protein
VVFLVYGAITFNSTLHSSSVFTYFLSFCIILGASCMAWFIMLPPKIKSDLMLKIKRHE